MTALVEVIDASIGKGKVNPNLLGFNCGQKLRILILKELKLLDMERGRQRIGAKLKI